MLIVDNYWQLQYYNSKPYIMFGGNNNGNRVLSGFLDETQIQYQNNAANQLQLFLEKKFLQE